MMGFALLRNLPLAWQIGIGIGVLAIAGTAYGVWHHHVYQRGYTAAIAAIAAQDQEAVNAAHQLISRRRACVASGGVWSQASGECSGR
jgi:hypothetical protein